MGIRWVSASSVVSVCPSRWAAAAIHASSLCRVHISWVWINICATFNSPWELLCISLFNCLWWIIYQSNINVFAGNRDPQLDYIKVQYITQATVFVSIQKHYHIISEWYNKYKLKGGWCVFMEDAEGWYTVTELVEWQWQLQYATFWNHWRSFIKTITSPRLCLYVSVHVHVHAYTSLCQPYIGRKIRSVRRSVSPSVPG